MALLTDSSFDTNDLLRKLERKATFHHAVDGLQNAVASCSPNNESKAATLWPLVQRCHTLLKTRYSSFEAWQAGKLLFTRCLELPFHPREMAHIRGFLVDAETEVTRADGGAAASTSADSDLTLADILLETSREPEAHFDDAGPIVDDAERLRRARGGPEVVGTAGGTPDSDVPAATGDATTAAAGGGGGAGVAGAAAAAAARGRLEQRAEMQRAILDGINAVYSGMDAVTRGTAAVESELDSIIDMLHANAGAAGPPRRPPPPASRLALAALPRVLLGAADLEGLGANSVCAVCTEELKLGDDVQLLPCKHSYHHLCLKPWLDKHNSCPICRHELPTDDARYEAQKEKDKEDEADRKGSANALSHREFMYT